MKAKKSELHAVEKDLIEDIEKVKNDLKETSNLLFHAVYEAKNMAQAAINQSFQKIKESSANVQGNVSAYVQENPIKTLGATVLIGFASAALFKLKRS